MNDLFCHRCQVRTRKLAFDPAAEPIAELTSGFCIWPDEVDREWCHLCISKARVAFHTRYRLTGGEPVSQDAVECFFQLEKQYPAWPIFRPERRLPEIAKLVRGMVQRATRRACVNAERFDRKYGQGREEVPQS